MTANAVESLSAPLRDRVIVIDVPDLTASERRRVAHRIFDEGNAAHGGAFRAIGPKAIDGLSGLRTRRVKAVLAQAMGYAALAGRRRPSHPRLIIRRYR